jgi:hypothetical protein
MSKSLIYLEWLKMYSFKPAKSVADKLEDALFIMDASNNSKPCVR